MYFPKSNLNQFSQVHGHGMNVAKLISQIDHKIIAFLFFKNLEVDTFKDNNFISISFNFFCRI